jgi:hypothetical protein
MCGNQSCRAGYLGMARRLLLGGAALLVALTVSLGAAQSAHAASLSGAIFTTLADGSEVNFNIYPSKEAVYLDGGPGPGAPQGAAGLPDGTYVFQVTNPSGKTLLSTDAAGCRQFTVLNGIITSVQPAIDLGCAHVTGTDVDHGATTVKLMPYLDTTNNGGEYKAWATPLADYVAGCEAVNASVTNEAQALAQVDCGYATGQDGSKHGFVPRDSKTDNFKVKGQVAPEIDTRFHGDVSNDLLDGRMITWTDTLGAHNAKWSYLNLALDVHHEAHVEAPELGTHLITIDNQTGCSVDGVTVTNTQTGKTYSTGVLGPQTVSVTISPSLKSGATIFIDVGCVGI